jgi:DNA-directed RNA polymerase specialized sigma24 family protein
MSGELEALYQQRWESLVRSAATVLHDRARAEDAVQDTFVRLLTNPPEALSTSFVALKVRWRALDMLRSDQRTVPLDAGIDEHMPEAYWLTDPADIEATALQRIEIQDAFDRCPLLVGAVGQITMNKTTRAHRLMDARRALRAA